MAAGSSYIAHVVCVVLLQTTEEHQRRDLAGMHNAATRLFQGVGDTCNRVR